MPLSGSQLGCILVAALVLAAPAASAQQEARANVQSGVLRCDVSAGVGAIVGSTRTLSCVFDRYSGRRERYQGTIRHSGLDLGATSRGVMVWAVLAPSRVRRGALIGNYAGANAEVTAGLGIGANILLGSDNSIVLQPLSVQAQVGINIAVGVAELMLERISRHPPRPPHR